MPDPIESAPATTDGAAASQGTQELEQVQEQPHQEEEEKKPEAPAESREFDITEVEMLPNGKLVWKVDPTDPSTTVYIADDLNGLFKEISKGTKAKDDYIKELTAKNSIKPDAAKGKSAPEHDATVGMPDKNAILVDTAKKYGVDVAMLSWTNDDWKQYEADNSSVASNRLYRTIESVVNEAQAAYDSQTAQFINDRTLDEETDSVQMLVKKYDLAEKFTSADYDKILDAVYADPENFSKRGVRKTGVIVRKVVEALDEIRASAIKKETRQEVETESARTRVLKGKLTPPAVKSKTEPISPIKAPSTIADAANEILKSWKQ
jgi:hypothetical protein